MEVIINGLNNIENYDDSCGYYGEGSDGSCAVDLSDGCDCDTYMGSGFVQE